MVKMGGREGRRGWLLRAGSSFPVSYTWPASLLYLPHVPPHPTPGIPVLTPALAALFGESGLSCTVWFAWGSYLEFSEGSLIAESR